MRSFEDIARELDLSQTRVIQLYYKGMDKLKKYSKEHPELKDYISEDITSNYSNNYCAYRELLKVLYDEYGRSKY